MAHHPEPSPSEDRPPKSSPEGPAPLPPESPVRPDKLEEVIHETAAQLGQASPADPELWAVLRQAAKDLPDGPLTLQPVAVRLVQVVLTRQLPPLADRPALLAATAQAVAEAILADLAAGRRLAALWERLREARP